MIVFARMFDSQIRRPSRPPEGLDRAIKKARWGLDRAYTTSFVNHSGSELVRYIYAQQLQLKYTAPVIDPYLEAPCHH